MRQRRWLELLSDYDCEIRYHPGKANVVVDALSRKDPKKLRTEKLEPRADGTLCLKGRRHEEAILVAQCEGRHRTMLLNACLMLSSNSSQGYDPLGLIVRPITKSAIFLPIEENDPMEKTGKFVLMMVVSRLEYLSQIICDRDPRCASISGGPLQKALGTSLDMSTMYHPQTDRQSERTIQTLEDTLRACVIDFGKGWVSLLPLVEFSYNKSYQASIKAAPFDDTFGGSYRSPVSWAEKCYADKPLAVPLDGLHIHDKLHFVEESVEIMDHEVKRLRQSRVSIVKVRWNSRRGPEFTWERED
ncbi:putative reverse transcriptase domain-containing protein [Tanacetum coccineum]